MVNYGLTTLMESIRQSDTTKQQNDQLFGLFEAAVDDKVASSVTGDKYELAEDNEDSVDRDLAGQGIGHKDEEKLEKLIETIPEDDTGDIDFSDEDIENVLETVFVGG